MPRKERSMKECEGRSCAWTKCCAATCHQGQRIRELKARVAGKSYSLERKVSSMRVACERDAKEEQLRAKAEGAQEA
jgi:hypothetical protein